MNGKPMVSYKFRSTLVNITIGDNAVIGKSAFECAASATRVTLGANAEIGEMAFYNCSALKSIDLSQAKSIGKMAFSGDVFYWCTDNTMQTPFVSNEGTYLFKYVSPVLESIDLSSVEMIDEGAFYSCQKLTSVVLGENLTELSLRVFMTCPSLSEINLDNLKVIGDYAFTETALTSVNLQNAETIGKYAFANTKKLTAATLNPNGSVVLEGAFGNATALNTVENLQFVTVIDNFAFTNTALTDVDLSAATKIGNNAFTKQKMTPFTVKLGEALVELGENPFAYCQIAPFSKEETVEFNGNTYTNVLYDFQLSESVYVIDGSLYMVMPTAASK
jgi:hypothetical protein